MGDWLTTATATWGITSAFHFCCLNGLFSGDHSRLDHVRGKSSKGIRNAFWDCLYKIFVGQMRLLSPSQQCHSTEGVKVGQTILNISLRSQMQHSSDLSPDWLKKRNRQERYLWERIFPITAVQFQHGDPTAVTCMRCGSCPIEIFLSPWSVSLPNSLAVHQMVWVCFKKEEIIWHPGYPSLEVGHGVPRTNVPLPNLVPCTIGFYIIPMWVPEYLQIHAIGHDRGKVNRAPQESIGGAHIPLPGLEPVGGEPLMSVTRGQCDASPMVTFPAVRYHRPLADTKLYCLVTWGMCVNNLPRVALDGMAVGIRTHDLLMASLAPYRYATKPREGMIDCLKICPFLDSLICPIY